MTSRDRYSSRCTPQDVIRISRDNATVRECLKAWEHGVFPTWEQAMMACVCYLADQNQSLTQRAILQDIARPVSIVITPEIEEEMRRFRDQSQDTATKTRE